MLSSTRKPKFLLDENVRIELAQSLIDQGFGVQKAPRSASDLYLAKISKQEKLVLVTNDKGFCEYTKEEIYSVVWLRIPQKDHQALTSSFAKLVSEVKDFAGKLIILRVNSWDDLLLSEEFE